MKPACDRLQSLYLDRCRAPGVWACAATLALVLSWPFRLEAADPPEPCNCYALTAWTIKDGLPVGNVLAITQDLDGYLWLGMNGSGLVRFDGFQFVVWNPSGDVALPGAFIPALVGSRDGSLWVGYDDASGVSQIRNGQVRNYSARDGLSVRAVAAMLEDSHGTLWVGGRGGLVAFHGNTWQPLGQDQGLPDLDVYSLYEDRQGVLWMGSSAGVFRQLVGENKFELHDARSKSVHSFAQDASGAMWVSDSRMIIRNLDEAKTMDVARSVRLPGSGGHLLRDEHDNLWVAALGEGLFRVHRIPATGRPLIERVNYERKFTGAARSLFQDRDKNIWVGLRAGGLLRVSEATFNTDIPLAGLTNDGVRALAASADGSIWVATGHSLNRFSGRGRTTYAFDQTVALHADKTGGLWAATARGIGRFTDGRFTPLPIRGIVRPESTLSFTETPDGLWLCSNDQGLFRWRNGVLTQFDDAPAVARRPCDFVYADSRGRVWVGFTAGGVAVYERDHFHFYSHGDGLASGSIQAIYEDRSGSIWIDTVAGLTRISEGHLTTVGSRNGLPDKLVPSIVEDADGYLWLGVDSASSVVRLNPEEVDKVAANPSHQIHYTLYGESDGLQGPLLSLSRPTAVRRSDGTLWFVSGLGVAVIDPHRLPERRKPPSMRIDRVLVDGKELTPLQQLALPGRMRTLQIDYAALGLSAASKLRFRYMLEGLSGDWVEAGTRRQISYTNLRPGSYRFRVDATGDGVRDGTGATWEFTVRAPFYRTYWFFGLCAVGAGVALWALWLLRLRAVRNEFALVIAERARVSRDIHDTLLQSLGAFNLQLEVVARQLDSPRASDALQYLRRQVGECIRDARRSVWELRSPRLEAQDLPEAFQQMANNMMPAAHATIDIVVNGKARRCSPDVEEHLLRIGQEAINNALRHGRADEIRVKLDYRRHSVSLSISDNGCGFALKDDDETTTDGHWGLKNMKERADALRGRLGITSDPGRGTVIETIVPL
jgi:signal transduction histidine kinase/ligand-binding sensor domain-containing protein